MSWFGFCKCTLLVALVWGAEVTAPAFELRNGDVVAFIGGGGLVQMQKEGRLEAALTLHWQAARPKFRDFAREGDTVYFIATERERWREEAFGNLNDQLDRIGATVIICQFGTMESFDGETKLREFAKSYGELIDRIKREDRRIVMLAPTSLQWVESAVRSALPGYVKASRGVAESQGVPFIDGERDDPSGAFILGLTGRDERKGAAAKQTLQLVQEKHRLWQEYWRPANWKCIFGDDRARVFSAGAFGLPSIQDEWRRYPELIAELETAIFNDESWLPPRAPKLTGFSDADVNQELAAFEVDSEFKVNLFADETLGVANPLSVRWDARGRMYVACSDVYPQVEPGVRGYDRIVTLIDTDDDGVADESKVFADGLLIPTGMEVGHDVVYVGQHTELLALRDTDGDGVANERTVLLSGFGNGDSRQTINSFIWGPDGELFMCQGDGIESRVETPFGVSSLFQAGVYRLRPDSLKLDGLLDDFMGPGNPWGVAFGSYGQSFVIDGAGGVSHLTPASIPANRRLRLPEIGKPGGYCGIDCLDASTFPSEMQGQFAIGDYKKNQISRFAVVPDGAGFSVEWQSPLLRSTHRNFRPVDVKIGPDGAIYVVDWYNPITCHQDDFFRHPDRDKTHGRIWRIAPKSGVLAKPKLVGEPVGELVDQLASPERWTRLKAKQLLAVEDRKLVEKELVAASNELFEEAPQLLIEYLSALEWVGTGNEPLLRTALGYRDHRVRAFATRMTGKWFDGISSAHDLLMISATDEHPLVRMEAILATAQCPDARSILVAARAAQLPTDRWIDYAFSQAVHYLKPIWIPAFKADELDFSGMNNGLTAVIAEANDDEIIEAVRSQLRDLSRSPSAWPSLAVALVRTGSDDDVRNIMDEQVIDAALLDALASWERPGFDVDLFVRQSIQSPDLDTRIAATELIGAWGVEERRNDLLKIARSFQEPMKLRDAATRGLGAIGDMSTLIELVEMFSEQYSPRTAVVAAMLDIDVETATSVVAREFRAGVFGKNRQLIFREFASRIGAIDRLAGQISKMDVDPDRAEVLRQAWNATGIVNDAMSKTLNSLAGWSAEDTTKSASDIARWVELGTEGNRVRGQQLFHSAEVGCAACHRVGDLGGSIGPDLSAVGSGLLPDRIVTEVLWPQDQVKKGYSLMQVNTGDGKTVQGYSQATRKKKTLLLRDFSSGEMHEIPAENIQEKTEIGSLMPATAKALSVEDLADLFAYLFGLRGQEQ